MLHCIAPLAHHRPLSSSSMFRKIFIRCKGDCERYPAPPPAPVLRPPRLLGGLITSWLKRRRPEAWLVGGVRSRASPRLLPPLTPWRDTLSFVVLVPAPTDRNNRTDGPELVNKPVRLRKKKQGRVKLFSVPTTRRVPGSLLFLPLIVRAPY